MSTVLIVLIASLTYIVPAAVMAAIAVFWKKTFDRDDRRSPLTSNQIHLPGEQLRQRLDKLDEAFHETFLMVCVMGPVFALVWLMLRLRNVDWSSLQFGIGDYMLALGAIAVPVLGAVRLVRLSRQRRRCKQGLGAEVITAQLLVPLQAQGCQIFHDIRCPGFNIDHVVVSQHAVFAIETKSRMKQAAGRESGRVKYDGSKLAFPTHVEVKPLDQARRQARWLAEHLTSATGDPVKVVPALSLPGWFVELTKEGSRSDVTVFNPKGVKFMTHPAFGSPIEQNHQRRIAHALTQMYPTPEETSP